MTGIYSGGCYCGYPTSSSTGAKPPAGSPKVPANQIASLWGDPHVDAADGGKYNFQHTGVFNMLSDQSISLNSLLTAKPNSDVTYDTEAGLQVGEAQAHFYGDGRVDIGSAEYGAVPADLNDGQTYSFGPTATIRRSGNSYTVKTPEYQVQVDTNQKDGNLQYLNVKTISGKQGVTADGVTPTGLLGETFQSQGQTDQSQHTQPDHDVKAYQVATLLPQFQNGGESDSPETTESEPAEDSFWVLGQMLFGVLIQSLQLLQQLLQVNGFIQ